VTVPDPKPTPTPQTKKKPITTSKKLVTRTPDRPTAKKTKTLSDEEIRKLLERGVPVGDHTVLPDEDTLSLESIRRAFYEAWDQPSREESAGKIVRAEITLAADGRITGRRILEKSGIPAMDDSVMRALDMVTRVNGLTADFHRRFPSVTIAFEVE
jgi:TonB family protein